MADRPRRRDEAESRTFRIAPERFHNDGASPVRVAVRRRPRHRARGIGLAPRGGDHAHVAARQRDEDHRAVCRGGFEQGGGRLAAEQLRQRGRIDDAPHDGIVGIGR